MDWMHRAHLAARRLMLMVALTLAFAAAPVVAQPYIDDERLDALFAQLRAAPDAATAQQIDQRIWSIWLTPTEPELAARMSGVLQARTRGDPIEAILLLNDVVEDYPEYAEAWNQRATMYYMIGNFNASIADCEKVLELEPRHFGALSGRALMYLQLDQRALALRDMSTALEIHPFLNERQLFPELRQEITRI